MEVYFDNSATTKPSEEVIKEITYSLTEFYGNPSSLHNLGLKSERKIKECRSIIANTINATESEIYFNGGATEGNNTILKGLLKSGGHVITTVFEHPSILNTIRKLESQGVKVTYLNVDSKGQIDIEELKSSINKDTVLVSLIFVNNEIGSIQNIKEIGKVIKEVSSRAKFHTDVVQGYGKFKIDVQDMNIDFLTASAHKLHGPKGVGFMYIRKPNKILPLIEGGSQESGTRAGTQNISGIMGMAVASQIANENMEVNYIKVESLKQKFIERLSEIEDIKINSPIAKEFSPYILNVSFIGVRGEVLLHYLEEEGIYVSTGSACSSKERVRIGGSYVLKSLGLSNDQIAGGIRFSFSDENTLEEVDYTIDKLKQGLKFLRLVNKRKR